MIDREAAIYAAGLFDGEGSFSVIHHRTQGRYYPMVQITMLDNQVVKDLAEKFGGKINYHRAGSGKRTVRGVWNGQRVVPFLEAIGPFLRVKKRQAEVVLEAANHQREALGKHGQDHSSMAQLYRLCVGLNGRDKAHFKSID